MYEPKVSSLRFYISSLTITQAFRLEKASWRAIIQLNVVRSIHVILDAMTRAQQSQYDPSAPDINSSPPFHHVELPEMPHFEPELLKLKLRLAPLLRLEDVLIRRLTPAGSAEYEATQFPTLNTTKTLVREVAINSTMAWKEVFSRLKPGDRDSFDSEQVIDWEDPNDPGRVLHECAEDMKKLWEHKTVQELLERQNLRLEEMAGLCVSSS